MAASEIFNKKINETINYFYVSRQGELVLDPLSIELTVKAGDNIYNLVVSNKLCISGTKTEALEEADLIEVMTKQERTEYLLTKLDYNRE
jgi:hypothetical protein